MIRPLLEYFAEFWVQFLVHILQLVFNQSTWWKLIQFLLTASFNFSSVKFFFFLFSFNMKFHLLGIWNDSEIVLITFPLSGRYLRSILQQKDWILDQFHFPDRYLCSIISNSPIVVGIFLHFVLNINAHSMERLSMSFLLFNNCQWKWEWNNYRQTTFHCCFIYGAICEIIPMIIWSCELR